MAVVRASVLLPAFKDAALALPSFPPTLQSSLSPTVPDQPPVYGYGLAEGAGAATADP